MARETIELRNPSKIRMVMNSRAAKRADGAIVPLTEKILPGATGRVDPNNPSIKIYALGGVLEPVDAVGRKWLEEVRAGLKIVD